VQHPGEERFLLFRSDRAGAIAKIVFSSVNDLDSRMDGDSVSCGKAVIHVLDVKAEHRGKDFGGLLFAQAMTALLQRYDRVDCRLDAEEDSRRHNRLLLFYQQLGCDIRPKAKVQYINNNDGETYRKIPMRIRLHRQSNRKSLVGVQFLPIQLLGATGISARLDSLGNNDLPRRIEWIVLEHGAGRIQFQTTLGQYLRMDEWGFSLTSDEMDDLCLFRIKHIQDQGSNDNLEGVKRKRNELWTLQSAQGHFLTIDCHCLAFSKEPAFWLADKSVLSLKCTSEALPLREHYRESWSKQTVAYVRDMSRRYSKFEVATMTIRQGLNLLRSVPLDKLRVPISARSPSLRTFCFRAAEDARIGGHPDWVQLIALM
jgi:GNAT superfamily N-acetyltransferase